MTFDLRVGRLAPGSGALVAPLSAALAALLALTCAAVVEAGSSVSAARAAGLVWGACLAACLGPLRLDLLSPGVIYFCLLGLFHLGLVVPWALGVLSAEPPLWLYQADLQPALRLVVLALLAYQLGVALALLPKRTGGKAPRPARRYYCTPLCGMGIFLICLGALAFWAGVHSLGLDRLLRADYAQIYVLSSRYDPRLFATSMTLVPTGFFLAAAGARWRQLPWVLTAAGAWTALILALGFRGYALVPVITLVAVLHQRGLRAPRWLQAAALAACLILIPAIRDLRAERLSERTLSRLLARSAPLAALEEAGGSLRALVHTVQFVDTEPFRWGRTYWQALKSALPNIALDWSGGSYIGFTDLPPSHWLTLQAAPETYRAQGGLGFSAVAEPYLNFGAWGVGVYFCLLGFGLVSAGRWDRGLPTRLAFWAVIFGPLLWTVRNDFHGFFRPACLGLAAVLAARGLPSPLHFRSISARERSSAALPRAAVLP
jgi:hypothetical protein